MARVDIAPRYVDGKTKDELIQAVLAYQARFGVSVKIITIMQEKSGIWTAWFTDMDREPKNLTDRVLR